MLWYVYSILHCQQHAMIYTLLCLIGCCLIVRDMVSVDLIVYGGKYQACFLFSYFFFGGGGGGGGEGGIK